jgi:hypothetical protein
MSAAVGSRPSFDAQLAPSRAGLRQLALERALRQRVDGVAGQERCGVRGGVGHPRQC